MDLDVEQKTHRLDGVVIGVLIGFAADGAPLVVFPGNLTDSAIAARTTAVLGSGDVGSEVALLFEASDPGRPMVIGRLLHPVSLEAKAPATAQPGLAQPGLAVSVERDGEHLELTAEREIVLRCGKASITLTRAGKVLIRGTYISSRSSGANRIWGGSVNFN